MIAGESIVVDTDSFENDAKILNCRDDVLTLLIHLGYLTYEEVTDTYGGEDDGEVTGLARIPNEEVRGEFKKLLRQTKHTDLIVLVGINYDRKTKEHSCVIEYIAEGVR